MGKLFFYQVKVELRVDKIDTAIWTAYLDWLPTRLIGAMRREVVLSQKLSQISGAKHKITYQLALKLISTD